MVMLGFYEYACSNILYESLLLRCVIGEENMGAVFIFDGDDDGIYG